MKEKKKDFTKIIMNPVRQRIVQYLLIHEKGTTGEMAEELNDIPPASLYRHVKILFEAGCLEVTEEKKIRGTIQKTYTLVKNPLGDVDQVDVSKMFEMGLLSLMGTFSKYFASDGADPQKDMLSLSTATLLLSDEEFMEMMGQIGEIYNKVIGNKPKEGRRPRRLTFISSPCEEE